MYTCTYRKQNRLFRVRVKPFQSTGRHLGHAWAGQLKNTRTEEGTKTE